MKQLLLAFKSPAAKFHSAQLHPIPPDINFFSGQRPFPDHTNQQVEWPTHVRAKKKTVRRALPPHTTHSLRGEHIINDHNNGMVANNNALLWSHHISPFSPWWCRSVGWPEHHQNWERCNNNHQGMLVYCAVRRPEIDYLRVIRLAQGTRISTNALTIDSLYIGFEEKYRSPFIIPSHGTNKFEKWEMARNWGVNQRPFISPLWCERALLFDKSIIVGERSINAFFSDPQSE